MPGSEVCYKWSVDIMNVEPMQVGGGGVGDNITVELTQDQAALLLPVLRQLMPNSSPAAGASKVLLQSQETMGPPHSSPPGCSSSSDFAFRSPIVNRRRSLCVRSDSSAGSETDSSSQYSSTELLTKKKRNSKSTDAQNYLCVSRMELACFKV